MQYAWDFVLVGWTIAVPLLLLLLAYKAPEVRTSDKLQLAALLVVTWFATSAIISNTNRSLLRWDQGLVTVMLSTLGIWVALHRLIAELSWRHRWLLHLMLVLFSGIFLFLMVGLYGFGTSHHY
jgi:hypothetical protein